MRRKGGLGVGVKSWMVVSETGHAHLEDVGKLSIMRRTGLPARDLRVLDPMLSHSSSILGRERAIVVNLEHVKAIITASEVLIINSSNPFFQTFLQHLHTRLTNQTPSPKSTGMYGNDSFQSGKDSGNGSPVTISGDSVAFHSPKISADDVTGTQAPPPKQLPFEFRALETCIESACKCLEFETSTLEKEAYPALDELTSQLSTLNLERVRQIKSRLVALSGRVQKIADELEHLLDDDNDMAEMYLTQKLNGRLLEQTSSREGYNYEFEENDQSDESYSERFDKFPYHKLDVEELEMLLEAYFAQTNGILQRLSSVSIR
ncbi:hypothetical protein Fmac_020085 [Flemingia macrophylla]|uniref:Magnesium transporter n=1 Tax=Flemingia macrophylla TaxID=520843 RepID=A0ABD1M9P9_9FABA